MPEKPLVYLAGPISGIPYRDAIAWRERVTAALYPDIICLDPLRDKEFLEAGSGPLPMTIDENPLCTATGIMARDFNDVRRCDLVLVNLLGAERKSVGTIVEIGWAYALRKPIVIVMLRDSVHDHPMITEAASFITADLLKAQFLVRSMLLPC